MKKRKDDAPTEQDIAKKKQQKIKREFSYLEKVDNISMEFAKAQANEICNYLLRLIIAPLPAWESFLLHAIEKDEDQFCYTFYVKKNEFGVFEPDMERISQLKDYIPVENEERKSIEFA